MRESGIGCTACFGGTIPCKGGGNLDCLHRCPDVQYIAAILDSYGGFRVVVGTDASIEANARDELVCIVPGLIVHEPIAWNDIPIVIERARLELEKWLAMRPNLTELQHQIVTIYRLRCLEHRQRSLDLSMIAET